MNIDERREFQIERRLVGLVGGFHIGQAGKKAFQRCLPQLGLLDVSLNLSLRSNDV